ncbi:unnamed protein product [Larinioides sclopetarius]|uniref:Uncharacterized protein n=1 Tax=Larinioides sclopetarius TaxID=280406 RepID=A0AAV2AH45_9ARAC
MSKSPLGVRLAHRSRVEACIFSASERQMLIKMNNLLIELNLIFTLVYEDSSVPTVVCENVFKTDVILVVIAHAFEQLLSKKLESEVDDNIFGTSQAGYFTAECKI